MSASVSRAARSVSAGAVWLVGLTVLWPLQPDAAGSTTPPAEPELYITAEEMPPKTISLPDGIGGYGAQRVHQLLIDAGIRYQMVILPWARAYRMALQQPDTCVFSTARTPAREPLFQWVGPTVQTDYVLYGLAGRDYQISQLSDARRYRIGSYLGDSRAAVLQQAGLHVQLLPDDTANPQMLLKNRLDLWATNSGLAQHLLSEMQLVSQIVPVFRFSTELLYLACHPSVPAAMILRMQQALDQMRADGRYDAFEQQSLQQRSQ